MLYFKQDYKLKFNPKNKMKKQTFLREHKESLLDKTIQELNQAIENSLNLTSKLNDQNIDIGKNFTNLKSYQRSKSLSKKLQKVDALPINFNIQSNQEQSIHLKSDQPQKSQDLKIDVKVSQKFCSKSIKRNVSYDSYCNQEVLKKIHLSPENYKMKTNLQQKFFIDDEQIILKKQDKNDKEFFITPFEDLSLNETQIVDTQQLDVLSFIKTLVSVHQNSKKKDQFEKSLDLSLSDQNPRENQEILIEPKKFDEQKDNKNNDLQMVYNLELNLLKQNEIIDNYKNIIRNQQVIVQPKDQIKLMDQNIYRLNSKIKIISQVQKKEEDQKKEKNRQLSINQKICKKYRDLNKTSSNKENIFMNNIQKIQESSIIYFQKYNLQKDFKRDKAYRVFNQIPKNF